MEFVFIVYLIGIIGNIGGFFLSLSIVSFIVALFFVIGLLTEGWDCKKVVTISSLVCVVFSIITALIPSKTTSWMMLGAYAGQKAIESDVGEDIMKLIKLKIKEEIGSLEQKGK